ncbi:MAG: IPT/TIG domain-containing protein [Acidobacteriota bacterium]
MRRCKLIATLVVALFFIALGITQANSGLPPLGSTNAPGEQTCITCHNSFSVNSGRGKILLTGIPREYQPGKTYPIEIIIDDPDASGWGFEVTILNERGQRAGNIRVTDPTKTELRNGSAGGEAREYLVPTIAGNFAGLREKAIWRFEWTAPERNANLVTFYSVGVAANLDNVVGGDRVYTSTTGSRMFEVKPPFVNFLTPTNGPDTGNTMVTFRGGSFRPDLKVTFDGVDAQVTFTDDTTVTVVTPPHKPGVVDIRITNADGLSVLLPRSYTYNDPPPPAPQILFTSPERGPTVGGDNVKVSGLNFRPGARVIFDGRELPTTFVDVNFLSIKTPLHNPGTVNVTVINPDGQAAELKNAYTYEGAVPPPVIKLLVPAGGEVLSAGGAPITIQWMIESNGTPRQRLLLSTDAGATFPIVLASGLLANETRFNWAVPEDLLTERARLRLEVVQAEGTVQDDSRTFKILRAAKIDEVTPATTRAGNTRLDLEMRGAGFEKGATVEMDGVKLKATIVSSTLIKIKKVPHNVPGGRFIRVRNPNGTISRSFLFTVAQ